ncbi:unnamed protein product [Ixodes hexagonus]
MAEPGTLFPLGHQNLTGHIHEQWPHGQPPIFRAGPNQEPPWSVDQGPSDNFQMALNVLRYLHAFFIPFLIVMGLIGNGLSFVTFLFTRLKIRASSFYLGTLALSDFGYLFVLTFVWLDKQGIKKYGIHISLMRNRRQCTPIIYLSLFRAAAMRCLSLRRCFRVGKPKLPKSQLYRGKKARRPAGGVALAAIFLGPFCNPQSEIKYDPSRQSKEKPKVILYYTNIMDTVVTLIVPFILIVIMNFMIGRALYLFTSRRRLQRANSSQLETMDADGRTTSAGFSTVNQRHQLPASLSGGPANSREGVLMHPSQISISRMLFLVCTVFIILNLPSYVVRIHVFALSLSDQPVPDHVSLLQRYFMLLYYTNFAVNFILYNVSSRIFRRMMKQYLWSKWRTIGGLCRSDESSYSIDLRTLKNHNASHQLGRPQLGTRT